MDLRRFKRAKTIVITFKKKNHCYHHRPALTCTPLSGRFAAVAIQQTPPTLLARFPCPLLGPVPTLPFGRVSGEAVFLLRAVWSVAAFLQCPLLLDRALTIWRSRSGGWYVRTVLTASISIGLQCVHGSTRSVGVPLPCVVAQICAPIHWNSAVVREMPFLD
jgi:hypothetical protein